MKRVPGRWAIHTPQRERTLAQQMTVIYFLNRGDPMELHEIVNLLRSLYTTVSTLDRVFHTYREHVRFLDERCEDLEAAVATLLLHVAELKEAQNGSPASRPDAF